MRSNRIFVPPIKCQGIKTKLVPFIKDISILNDKGKWIEPFMGSGVVGFNIRSRKALFCDINPHIIAFYNAIRISEITPHIAREFLEKEGKTLISEGEKHYYHIRERFNSLKNPLDFLFLSRSCFNGMVRFNKKGQFNVPFCHKPNRFSKSYITKIINQIRYVHQANRIFDWEFVCQEFENTILKATKYDVIYCDPPYYGRHVDYFDTWSEKDEKKLYSLLNTTDAKFILSSWYSNEYRCNPMIDKYWKSFTIIKREHFYHIGAKENNRHPMTEALILNFDISDKTIEVHHEQTMRLEFA